MMETYVSKKLLGSWNLEKKTRYFQEIGYANPNRIVKGQN